MGFGYALGGIAKGLEAGSEISRKRQALALDALGLQQNKSFQERSLDIRQQEVSNSQQQELVAQSEKIIADATKNISELIPKALEAGQTPEQIAASIEPVLQYVDKLSSGIGKDSNIIRSQIKAQLSVPAQPEKLTSGATLEGIKAKMSQGQTLTPGETQLYQDSLKTQGSETVAILKALGIGGEGEAAPASAAPAAPAEAAPVSKGPLPMPATKSALEKGQVYNLPDGRQGFWNGTAFEIL